MSRINISFRAFVVMFLATPRLAQAQDTTKTFFTRRDAYWAGFGLAGGAVISIFDKRIAHWWQSPSVQGSSSRHDFVKSLTIVNETPLTIGAFVTYGVGRLTKNETVADVGLHATEALVLTVGLSEAIRGPIGRLRPRNSANDQYDFLFWGGFTDFARRSYPSLHSAVGFATASAIVQEIHFRHPQANVWAAPVLYTAALIPGVTRLYLDEHWASDVFSGAVLGAVLGTKVVNYAHTHKRNKLDHWLLGAIVVPSANGLMVGESIHY
jgi:membrane-associated phospholipid phosphatase